MANKTVQHNDFILRCRWVWVLALTGLLSSGIGSLAQEAERIADNDFQAFKLIFERNIFNPDRSAGRGEEPPSEQVRPESRRVETESLVLLGTISYEKGSFGFFDGSRPDFRKTVPLDESIAGFRLVRINARDVRLEADGRSLELAVGKQLSKREDETEWKIVDRIDSFAQGGTSAELFRGGDLRAGDTAKPKTSAPSDAGADEAEILKRLMQQREQELSNEK